MKNAEIDQQVRNHLQEISKEMGSTGYIAVVAAPTEECSNLWCRVKTPDSGMNIALLGNMFLVAMRTLADEYIGTADDLQRVHGLDPRLYFEKCAGLNNLAKAIPSSKATPISSTLTMLQAFNNSPKTKEYNAKIVDRHFHEIAKLYNANEVWGLIGVPTLPTVHSYYIYERVSNNSSWVLSPYYMAECFRTGMEALLKQRIVMANQIEQRDGIEFRKLFDHASAAQEIFNAQLGDVLNN
jgi:hypothetical protein